MDEQIYKLESGSVTLKVASLGAELQSICKDGEEYLWNGDDRYWPERSPILFPFVGRLTDGKYLLDGTTHEMNIHGFARKLPYKIVKYETGCITFELRDSEETYFSYPFHFVLQVTYLLHGDEIQIEYRVKNLSEQMMCFGIGGHPGFRVPLENDLEFEDYYLEFGSECRPERIGHTQNCFLSGNNQEFVLEDRRRIRLTHEMFDEDAIVLQNMADEVTLKSDRGSRQVKVSYPHLRYLGLWHAPHTCAPYICIEPWTSLPSRQGIVEEFRYKNDLIRLDSGSEYYNRWQISIQ